MKKTTLVETTSARTKQRSPSSYWNSYTAWLAANMVLLVICLPLMTGLGYARGWNIDKATGRFDILMVVDANRFWPEPNAYEANKSLDAQIPGRDSDVAYTTWYYWKHRPTGSNDLCVPGDFDPITEPQRLSCNVPEARAGARAFVWACYLVHQFLIWGIIYKAQQEEHLRGNAPYHFGLRWYNVWSLIVNCCGYLLHLAQTHLTYDSLAQDTTTASSQGSVVMVMVMVLVMEYKHRGMILGWTSSPQGQRSWSLPTPPMELVRKYHGYAFAWATIFTLWYHPMEPTAGHITGFLHVGILLIQQSLIFTPLHVNRYWKVLLEASTTIHGGVVAYQKNTGKWASFLFGFLWMFCFTQIHGIPYYLGFAKVEEKRKKAEKQIRGNSDQAVVSATSSDNDYQEAIPYEAYIPTARWKRYLLRLVPAIAYFVIVIGCYSTVLKKPGQKSIGIKWIAVILRIPVIFYLLAYLTVAVAWGMLASTDYVCCKSGSSKGERAVDGKDKKENGDSTKGAGNGEWASSEVVPPARKRVATATAIAVFLVCYTVMVAFSIVLEAIHLKMRGTSIMLGCVAVFTVMSLVAMIVVQDAEQPSASLGPQVSLQTKEHEE